MKITGKDILFSISLLLAIWFALTAWVWPFGIALVFSYPIGIISLIMMLVNRRSDPKSGRYKVISGTLFVGFVVSVLVLAYILIVG